MAPTVTCSICGLQHPDSECPHAGILTEAEIQDPAGALAELNAAKADSKKQKAKTQSKAGGGAAAAAQGSDGGGQEFEVESIIDKVVKNGSAKYRVRWKGFGPEEDSWEPAENLESAVELLNSFEVSHIPPSHPPTSEHKHSTRNV